MARARVDRVAFLVQQESRKRDSKHSASIQESLFTQYVIETLSGPPRVEIHIEDEKVANDVKTLQMAGAKLSPLGPMAVSPSPKVTVGGGRLQKSPTRTGKVQCFCGLVPRKTERTKE
ncbi:unnamed protein product [Arabis nemorensis]|uniref:Uncharacterized protein n=1 Tax=Arabis nemorensis TaxID=586526 RepID=A0A565BI50_9BRAS|nr:unnamed protein product [Arabis nemorensis]